jgi:hypothetical protein
MGKIKHTKDCRKLHHLHYGSGHPVFKGDLMQEGYGLGGIISGLFRRAIPIFAPILKEGAKTIGKVALKTGRNVLADVVNDKSSFKDSLRKRVGEALSADIIKEGNLTNKPQNQSKRRKTTSKKYIAHKRNKKDIFQ